MAAHAAAAITTDVKNHSHELHQRVGAEFAKLGVDGKHFEEFHRQFEAERGTLVILSKQLLEPETK